MHAVMVILFILLLIVPVVQIGILIIGCDTNKVRRSVYLIICIILYFAAVFILIPKVLGETSIGIFINKVYEIAISYQELGKIAGAYAGLTLSSLVVPMILLKCLRKHISTKNKSLAMSFFVLEAIVSCMIYGFAFESRETIHIAEVCRKYETLNNGKITKEGYVTLVNTGMLLHSVDELKLATEQDLSDAITYTNVEIQPGQSKCLKLDYDDGLVINKDGGSTIYLADAEGIILDEVDVVALDKNEVYKKNDDGQWEKCVLEVETDEKKSEDYLVEMPNFSEPSGFFDSEFKLEIIANKGDTVYYTLDGSIPTVQSLKYSEPIRVYNRSKEENIYRNIPNVIYNYKNNWINPEIVDKAFIIRAISVDRSGNESAIANATYFVGLDESYKNGRVISIVSDPAYLFGDDGIYVTGKEYDQWYLNYEGDITSDPDFNDSNSLLNYRKKGISSERIANIDLFDKGEEILNQPTGIRIQGASARGRALKRFSMYARDIYSGSDYFEAQIFKTMKSHSFTLREGAINSIGQALVADRQVATQDSYPVMVFLNGEYWYTSFMQEKYSNFSLANKYGVDKDNIEMMKIGYITETPELRKKYESEIKNFIEANDFSEADAYKSFCEMADVQSYIDFMCSNIYMGNADFKDTLNVCYWRTEKKENDEYGDGRWRWGLYDFDLGIDVQKNMGGYSTTAEINSFTEIQPYNDAPIIAQTIYSHLRKNQDFCQQFVVTFMDMLNYNFDPVRVQKIFEEYGYGIEYDDYFFRDRPEYMVKYLAEEFELKGTPEEVTLKVENLDSGTITLNTITPEMTKIDNLSKDEFYSWTGKYYTDYPITVTANGEGGHEFQYWIIKENGVEKIVNETSIEIDVKEGGVEIVATFK